MFSPDGRERAERHDLYGLGVLQVRCGPAAGEKGRLRRGGKNGWLKAECGESQVPWGFDQWPVLERWG